MSEVTWWRERVSAWRFVKVPISVGLIVLTSGALVATVLLAPNVWFALLWLVPIGIAVQSLRVALDGLQFASKVLAEHEDRERMQFIQRGPSDG